MSDRLENKMFAGGYGKSQFSEELKEFRLYYYPAKAMINTVLVVNASDYVESHVRTFREAVKSQLEDKGLSVHFFTLVVIQASLDNPAYAMEYATARQVCDRDQFCWIYDVSLDRPIIYENQVEDFYGLKAVLDASDVTDFSVKEEPEKEKLSVRIRRFFKTMPKVTASLVLINLILFVICTFTGTLLYNKGGVGIKLVETPDQWYRIITSMFLHIGVQHIAGNMIMLYFLGDIVEHETGSLFFVICYFITGITGSLATFISEIIKNEYIVVFGASGAVFGLLGLLLALVLFKRIDQRLMSAGRVVFAIVISVYNGFSSANVANWSHLGGLVSGIVLGVIYCLFSKAKKRENL